MKASNAFRKKLKDISMIHNCPISKEFFTLEGPLDYFAIPENKKQISYLDPRRYERIKKAKFKVGDYVSNIEIQIRELDDSYVNNRYYIKALKKRYIERLRYQTSPAKLIGKVFPKKFTQQEIDNFVAYWYGKDIEINEKDFLIDGNVNYWYLGDNYYSHSGQLGQSCMKYKRCQKYFGIYNDNKNISIAVFHRDKKVLARTILWENKYFDRIYGVSNSIQIAFGEFLEKKGYTNIYETDLKIDIKLEETDFEYYPYMDTFRSLSDWGVSSYVHEDEIMHLDCELGYDAETCYDCDERMERHSTCTNC